MFRRPVSIGLFAVIPVLAGCMHFVHKPPDFDEFAWRPADAVSDESKSCVFVFLIDPVDPLVTANTTGLRDFIQKLGFIKTFYGQSCHASFFLEKMRWIRARSESARFVVIGYRGGADAGRRMVQTAAEQGSPVDLAIYLEPGDTDASTEESSKVFVMCAEELEAPEASESGDAKSHQVRKSDVPTHPQTLSLIERELTLLAMSVPPHPRLPATKVLLVPPMPSPRNTPPKPGQLPAEWQFLQPKYPWEQPPPTLPAPIEPLPLPKVVPALPIPKSKP